MLLSGEAVRVQGSTYWHVGRSRASLLKFIVCIGCAASQRLVCRCAQPYRLWYRRQFVSGRVLSAWRRGARCPAADRHRTCRTKGEGAPGMGVREAGLLPFGIKSFKGCNCGLQPVHWCTPRRPHPAVGGLHGAVHQRVLPLIHHRGLDKRGRCTPQW